VDGAFQVLATRIDARQHGSAGQSFELAAHGRSLGGVVARLLPRPGVEHCDAQASSALRVQPGELSSQVAGYLERRAISVRGQGSCEQAHTKADSKLPPCQR